ncbi:uncharacterized protein LOC135622240 [Musa acuminata AAA Group]|uniref:uncharacterized protein LOC135622240 n=1 Tax=Musa acuminata AAA Group TaxID=214697 RepID=UPI0031DA98EA
MADDAQRMVALKRAYADVILNTAKESAARILAADRRVVQSQHSLSLAKEESLAMLLRLKSIMDAKIKDAENVNLSQARRIQELEVQLSEAKETIHHLNSELTKVSSEVESEKSYQIESLEEQRTHGCVIVNRDDCQEGRHTSVSAPCSQVGAICSPNSDFNVTTSKQRTADKHRCFAKYTAQNEPSKEMVASDDSAGSPDLVSIILRNKELDLYRNGCTQRVRAFEQNLLTEREPCAQMHDQFFNAKREAVTCDDDTAERHKTRDLALSGRLVVQVLEPLESEEVGQQGNMCENDHTANISCQHPSEKPGVRKPVTSSGAYHEIQDHEQLDISDSKVAGQNSMPRSCEKERHDGEGAFSCLVEASRGDHRTSKDGNMKLNKLSDHVISGTLNTSRVMTRRTMKLCGVNGANGCGGSTTSVSINSSQENIKKELVTMSTFDMKDSSLLVADVKNDTIDTQLEKESMLKTLDHKMAKKINTSDLKDNHERIGVPLTSYDSKDERSCGLSGLPPEVGKDRIVKYTFRRTRKRRSPDSNNDDVFLEKINMPKKKARKENASLEPPKPNLVKDSTRDSRKIAQVARQLIALSEKRW